MQKIVPFIIVTIFFTTLNSCKEKDNDPGSIILTFEEKADGQLLQTDTLKYVNEAGNPYMITEVQYFISKLTLHFYGGESYVIKDDMGIHYIDSDLPETKTWNITDGIPSGVIDSISFIFGMDETDNQSNRFTNPPESNMFWPEQLGGGYHYMKLNGKWLNTEIIIAPYNFHLGIGQTYDTTGQITGFVQNYFRTGAILPVYSSYALVINPIQTSGIVLVMNLESWFKTPNTWDFNAWGGMIMQNQEAMHKACENGKDAFTLESPFIFQK